MLRDERGQRLLRRDPAFALARSRGSGERLRAARQPVELGHPAARRCDRPREGRSGRGIDRPRRGGIGNRHARVDPLGGARRERGKTGRRGTAADGEREGEGKQGSHRRGSRVARAAAQHGQV